MAARQTAFVVAKKFMQRCGFGLAMLSALVHAQDGVTVGAHTYSGETVELLHRAAQRDKPDWTIADTVALLIDNQLLAELAIEDVGEEALLHSEARVGFPDREVIAKQFLATTVFLFQARQSADGTQKPSALPPAEAWACDSVSLRERLALGSRQEFYLPEAALGNARNTSVLRAQLTPTRAVNISLAELYQQQNVQGRIALHNGDCAFLHAIAWTEFADRYWLHWLHHESGVASTTLMQLQHAIKARYLKDQYLARLGLAADAHDDSWHLRDVAKTISDKEIAEYYHQHRDQFMRVSKAKGRHLRVSEEALADRIYTELTNGLTFSDAMQRYAKANSDDSDNAGHVDWIENAPGLAWRDALFLILPVNQANRPLKVPQRDRWELIWVDERIEVTQAADSEGVRYQVGAILARQKVLNQLQSDLAKRRQITPIRVPAAWRQFDPRATAE